MTPLSRRQLAALSLGLPAYAAAVPGETHQSTGCKVGEMTPVSARFWLRRTAASTRLANGIVRRGQGPEAKLLAPGIEPATLEGAAMGAPGYVRVVYRGPKSGASAWLDVNDSADFATQVEINGLRPGAAYTYAVETRATRNGRVDGELTGAFRSLPLANASVPAHVALLSCQMYCHMDRPDGFHIYESIQREAPQFLLSCGDNVYYDNEDPIVNSEALARYHWQRMYSLPTLVNCLRQVGCYWQKDDHDVLSDDSWPSRNEPKMNPFTFVKGQRIFREQVPVPPGNAPLYRTVRVGADLELWLPESRDYRSANTDPDGPNKTIWGDDQKQWLVASLAASRATWKVIVNPNPIVGPDRQKKNDNHANAGFAHESREIRRFLRNELGGQAISVCGDRHWQYHSVDPETGLHEFGCGPASDLHAGGTPGLDPLRHKFHRVLGGYLTINASREALRLRHRDVHGATVYEYSFAKT
ncbi:MAG: alkaline phosphatase D family protein [Bryobacteraceae bacterium]|nr:alkaline phosphatase D family protein [Bryobacteraceae bacterium]